MQYNSNTEDRHIPTSHWIEEGQTLRLIDRVTPEVYAEILGWPSRIWETIDGQMIIWTNPNYHNTTQPSTTDGV